MTATEFNELVKRGPCTLKMNNGDEFEIERAKMAIADIRTAAILAMDQDGTRCLRLITLGNISSATTQEAN